MVDYCTFFVVLLSAPGFSKSRLEGMGWILHTQVESRFILLGLHVTSAKKLMHVNFQKVSKADTNIELLIC